MSRLHRHSGRKRTVAGEATLDIGGRAVPLRIKRDWRARRLTLRIDPMSDAAVVTLPPWVPVREGLDLAIGEAPWILARLQALPTRVEFADGATVPLGGIDHRIEHRPAATGGVWLEDRAIVVTGRAEHLKRRVVDWLRREAVRRIQPKVAEKAAILEAHAGRVYVRDTKTLWGSCAPNGDLSFCWRLVMAPEFVLDYVVSHEVAHLRNRSHGPKFWKLVDRLTDAAGPARAWLSSAGEALHRYG